MNVERSLHFSALVVSLLLRWALLPARCQPEWWIQSCLYFYLSLLSNFDEVRPFFVSKTNSEFELILTSIYNPPRELKLNLTRCWWPRRSISHLIITLYPSPFFCNFQFIKLIALTKFKKWCIVYFGFWIMNRIEIKVKVRSSVSQTLDRHDKVWNYIPLPVQTRLGCRASNEPSRKLKLYNCGNGPY